MQLILGCNSKLCKNICLVKTEMLYNILSEKDGSLPFLGTRNNIIIVTSGIDLWRCYSRPHLYEILNFTNICGDEIYPTKVMSDF